MRLRFFSPFGGAGRSLPPAMERFAELAVGDAISVPSELEIGDGGIGTDGSIALSSKILPKSTGEDDVALVHGTEDGAAASGAPPGGEPGIVGDMRELEIVDGSLAAAGDPGSVPGSVPGSAPGGTPGGAPGAEPGGEKN